MPDLLLELRSEEIPARMQRRAAGDLKRLVTEALVDAGLAYEAAREYWTPRRLALDVRGVTARSRDVREEIKGPSTKAPEQAIQGFLRKAGLSDVSRAEVRSDPKKGDFYVAALVRPGRAAEEIVAETLPRIIRDFPWPKSMRWGAASGPKGVRYGPVEGRGGEALRWVRPLQSILCTFGPETEEPVVVPFEVEGIRSGNTTVGHRFHAPGEFSVRRFDDYAAKLEAAKVVLDAERRKQMILADAQNLAFASGLTLVEDEGLLEEVSGLVEWPVVLMGEFEADFLEIPSEVIRLTIRANQKCFVTRPQGGEESAPTSPLRGGRREAAGGGAHDQAAQPPTNLPPPLTPPRKGEGDGGNAEAHHLSSRFILTANVEARDGGREIARGNGKVVRARLSDALYFWKTDQSDLPDLDRLQASAEKFGLDLKKPLDQRMARLDHLGVTFHAKLGTQGERVERIRRLARELAPAVAPSSGPSGHLLPEGRRGAAELSALPLPWGRGQGEGDIAALAERAAVLAKADLQTEVVGEFPELQGVMGRKYALLQGEHPSVAAAVEEHYKPQGPSDRVPADPVSIAVALADKLDTLVGFWAIDEKPTGSKDPYALRRAALGVIRIVVENRLTAGLHKLLLGALRAMVLPTRDIYLDIDESVVRGDLSGEGFDLFAKLFSRPDTKRYLQFASCVFCNVAKPVDWKEPSGSAQLPVWLSLLLHYAEGSVEELTKYVFDEFDPEAVARNHAYAAQHLEPELEVVATDLLSFFHDRLKVYLRDQGARHDLIDAVLAAGAAPSSDPSGHLLPEGRRDEAAVEALPLPSGRGQGEGVGSAPANDDLLSIVRRVEALGKLLDTEDGKNLLAGTKRAANILAAEEKKGTAVAPEVDPEKFTEEAERTLFAAVTQAEKDAGEAIGREDFSAAMRALASLRAPIDAFFDQVLVNDEDAQIRANRLALLNRIRAATGQVADFSRIAG